MGARRGIGLGRLVILAMLAVTLAFGSGLRAAPLSADPQIAAILAAGGSLADICHDGGTEKATPGQHCIFCPAAVTSLLPEAGSFSLAAERRILAEVVRPAEIRAAAHARDPAVSPRGPPTRA